MENFTIDRQKKSFVFDDGEVIPIPKDKQKQVLRSQEAKKSKEEASEKWKKIQNLSLLGDVGHTLSTSANENFFGNLGSTAANYLVSGAKSLKKGEGQEQMGYIDRVLDHFYAMQEARKEHLGALQSQNPVAAGVGKGLGIIGELGALYGVPGAIALPAMGAGASETSFLEPGEKFKEVTKDALTGAILDKFFGGLGKIAGHRQAQRGVKNAIRSAEEANIAETQRAATATEAEKARFTNETALREQELQNTSRLQNAENEAFQKANNASIDTIAKTMGKNSVASDVMGVEEFIDSAINTSAHAASTEANYASRFLRSIFKGDKSGKITGQSLKKGMRALDEAILKNEGATQQILTDYKNFISRQLPERFASSYIFEKWVPTIAKSAEPLEKDLLKVLNSSPEIHKSIGSKLGTDYIRKLNAEVEKSITDVMGKYKNGIAGIDEAVIRQEIQEAISLSPSYQKLMGKVDSLFPQLSRENAFKTFPKYQQIHGAIENYPSVVADRVSSSLDRHMPNIIFDFTNKGDIVEKAIQKAPINPNVLPLAAPVQPSQAIKPNLQPVPQMPAPQGVYGKLAQGLESLRDLGTKGAIGAVKNNAPTALLAKLAGLPLAKTAIAGVAGATGLRALTSPSIAGQALRGGLEQGSRLSISIAEKIAENYPSYHKGIIEDPQERRSFTKEIEDNPEIPLEQKAILQSKANRGKPLQERLI